MDKPAFLCNCERRARAHLAVQNRRVAEKIDKIITINKYCGKMKSISVILLAGPFQIGARYILIQLQSKMPGTLCSLVLVLFVSQ